MLGNGLKWMFLIIGTMIGAGYASGRELWEFFGSESGLAIILYTILFIICITVILKIGYENKSTHYLPILEKIMGKKLTKLYDLMIVIYLFSTTVIMLAGGGATLEVFKLPYWLGIGVICGLLIFMFIWDTKGMTSMNSIVIPLLIISLLGVLISFLYTKGFPIEFSLSEQNNWPAALTFTALNILPLIAVLGAIGSQIKKTGEIWIASVGSGLILGSISFIYNESLIQVAGEIILYEIPLFAILENYPYFMIIVMSILLWIAIYTTASAGIFGLVSRFRTYVDWPAWLITLVMLIGMVPLTMIGFSTLISVLYPLYGLLNLYVFSALLLYPIIKRNRYHI